MSAERCNCGTHTKEACDFAGACGPVAAPLPAAPAPTEQATQTWQERVDSEYLAHWKAYEQNHAEAAMLAEITDLRAARAAPQATTDSLDAARWRYVRDTETLETAVWEALEGTDCAPGGVFDRAAYAAGMDRAVDAAIAQEKAQ